MATFSHLVLHSKLIELNVMASDAVRQARGDAQDSVAGSGDMSQSGVHVPDLAFQNDAAGTEPGISFAQRHLLPFFDPRIEDLADMVRSVADFPRLGAEFRHILGIAQHRAGLSLCTSLIEDTFAGDWSKIDAIISCKSGGFIFGSPLSAKKGVPLVLVREAGKLPPPTVSSWKDDSHMSALDTSDSKNPRIEVDRNVIRKGGSVVVVDDVLATGKTLVGVLQLLQKAGVKHERVRVMVVAEFPGYQGRKVLQQRGFGDVRIQNLLVFGSM